MQGIDENIKLWFKNGRNGVDESFYDPRPRHQLHSLYSYYIVENNIWDNEKYIVFIPIYNIYI